MPLKTVPLLAASFALLSAPAFAQGGSPYNSSGSQSGQERAMGARGGTPTVDPEAKAPPTTKRAKRAKKK